MSGEIWLYDSEGNVRRKIKIDDNTGELLIYDNEGNQVFSEKHGQTHICDGSDAIPEEGLCFSQVAKKFGDEVQVTVSGSGTILVPKGIYIVAFNSDIDVEYSPDDGATWRAISSGGFGGMLISDGESVRFKNNNTSDVIVYMYPVV